jgi:hypothetical protein
MTFEDPASTVLARIQAEADLSVDLEPDPFDSFDDEGCRATTRTEQMQRRVGSHG